MDRFIARDTKEPLRVMGGYDIAADGSIIRDPIRIIPGADYGCDPMGDGTFRLVPSGRIVTLDECNRVLGR